MSLLHEQPNRVWEGSSIVIVIKFRSKRPGFSAANSSASWVFRCTKLEWLNPTQQGTRTDVPPPILKDTHTRAVQSPTQKRSWLTAKPAMSVAQELLRFRYLWVPKIPKTHDTLLRDFLSTPSIHMRSGPVASGRGCRYRQC